MLAAGTTIGRYVILDPLGEGAMGEVYRAWDDALDRVVALKLLLPLRAESAAARKRFVREARLTARINHPCVAHVYDIGDYEESPFIAMEFVPGRQLRVEMTGPMPVARIVGLTSQIIDGLAEAHKQRVVHRDLKPENILIAGHDSVKLLDFGLAKPILDEGSDATELTTSGLTGTPRYMAPEQIQGGSIDARTDIYALGALLYEMVTGRPAHAGRNLGEILMAVANRPAPELPETLCPPPLARMIKQALQKSPSDRFQDVREMMPALAELGRTPHVPASPRAVSSTHVPHQRAVTYTQRAREAMLGTSSSSSLSIDILEKAIELDPHYALAHAVYAEACAALFNSGHDAVWLDRAQAALERAEELEPGLPDVRVARARLLWTKTFNFPAETALRELRLALARDPDHAGALRLWATIAAHVGLIEHAERAVAQRLRRDSNDDVMRAIRASLWIATGEPERALETLEPVLHLDPSFEDALYWWIHAHALVVLGRTEDAERSLAGALGRRPEDPLLLSLGGVARAIEGDSAGAERLCKKAAGAGRGELHPHHAHHLIACAYSVLGRTGEAHEWLRRTADCGMPCYPWFLADPLLENLRRSPEGAPLFDELARRHAYFEREFPAVDPAAMSYTATEVADA